MVENTKATEGNYDYNEHIHNKIEKAVAEAEAENNTQVEKTALLKLYRSFSLSQRHGYDHDDLAAWVKNHVGN